MKSAAEQVEDSIIDLVYGDEEERGTAIKRLKKLRRTLNGPKANRNINGMWMLLMHDISPGWPKGEAVSDILMWRVGASTWAEVRRRIPTAYKKKYINKKETK